MKTIAEEKALKKYDAQSLRNEYNFGETMSKLVSGLMRMAYVEGHREATNESTSYPAEVSDVVYNEGVQSLVTLECCPEEPVKKRDIVWITIKKDKNG